MERNRAELTASTITTPVVMPAATDGVAQAGRTAGIYPRGSNVAPPSVLTSFTFSAAKKRPRDTPDGDEEGCSQRSNAGCSNHSSYRDEVSAASDPIVVVLSGQYAAEVGSPRDAQHDASSSGNDPRGHKDVERDGGAPLRAGGTAVHGGGDAAAAAAAAQRRGGEYLREPLPVIDTKWSRQSPHQRQQQQQPEEGCGREDGWIVSHFSAARECLTRRRFLNSGGSDLKTTSSGAGDE
jgi:hypothetical protein